MVGLQARGDPTLRYLHDLIAEGYIGKVVAVNMTLFTAGVLERPASRLWDRDKTKGVSALTVRGIHSMDTLCHCLGDFAEVSAKVATQVKQWKVTDTGAMVDVDAADNVLVNGVLEGGALASVHVATLPYHTTGWRMEIYGRGGTLRVSTKGSLQRDANTLLGARPRTGRAAGARPLHGGPAGDAAGSAEQCRSSVPAHGEGDPRGSSGGAGLRCRRESPPPDRRHSTIVRRGTVVQLRPRVACTPRAPGLITFIKGDPSGCCGLIRAALIMS